MDFPSRMQEQERYKCNFFLQNRKSLMEALYKSAKQVTNLSKSLVND